MSAPKTPNADQSSFFYPDLLNQLNPKHPLLKLGRETPAIQTTLIPAVRFKNKIGARCLKLCLYINLWDKYSRNWDLKDYFPNR